MIKNNKPLPNFVTILLNTFRSSLVFPKFQHISKLPYKIGEGYTLIEALVAISIILVATTAPFVRIQDSLNDARFAQDQVIATYLAQEGIELVRAIRDSNRINEDPNFLNIDGRCGLGVLCTAHVLEPLDTALKACSGECKALFIKDGFYHHGNFTGSSPEVSRFTRSVLTTPVSNNLGDELEVTVEVSWETRPGASKSIRVSEHMFDFSGDS